jgi:hypothetical protein
MVHHYFYKKLSLYIQISNIYLGLGFEFGPQRNRDLAIVCLQSVAQAACREMVHFVTMYHNGARILAFFTVFISRDIHISQYLLFHFISAIFLAIFAQKIALKN